MKTALLAPLAVIASTLPNAGAEAATFFAGGGSQAPSFGGATPHPSDVFDVPGPTPVDLTLPEISGIPASGSDNAAKYSPALQNAVPEPTTWGMMIAGYLLVGVALRYRGRKLNTGYY